MQETYLKTVPGGRWAISRFISGKNICLVQNSYLDEESDIPIILQALSLEVSWKNMDLYFPILKARGRCPTLELLELFAKLNQFEVDKRDQIGV